VGNVCRTHVLLPVPRGPRRKKDCLGGWRRRGYKVGAITPSYYAEK
jgi:hypothetical protein